MEEPGNNQTNKAAPPADQFWNSMEISEPQTVRLAREGQTDRFGDIYDAYVNKIYNFIYFRTHHKETAEDLTSQVFFKALEKLDSYNPRKGKFSTWLYQIAKNTVIDHYRAKKPEADLKDAWDLPSGSDTMRDADTAHKLEQVQKYLGTLPPLQRDIVIMRVWDGLSHGEIAAILKMSEASVKMAFSRTLSKLNKELAYALLSLLLLRL